MKHSDEFFSSGKKKYTPYNVLSEGIDETVRLMEFRQEKEKEKHHKKLKKVL